MRKKTLRSVLLSLLLALVCGLGTVLAACSDDGEKDKQPSVYTVTFETDGGTAVDSVQWTEGTPLSVQAPTKTKYDFAGWYYDDACTDEADLADLHAEGDFTLYAKWDYIPQTYTVTFETDGGTAVDAVQWTEKTTLTVQAPTKGKYDFAGWYYDDARTDEADLTDLHAEGDFTLYAKWDYIPQTYPVTFETHGGSDVAQASWTEGEALDVAAPTREGYTFAGWYFDEDLENEADTAELEVQSAETTALTLHAKWEAKEYSITIYPDHDGEGEPTVKKYKTDETVDPSQWETPTLVHEGENISFLYWEPETGGVAYRQDETFTMPAKNLALYPVFDMPQLFNWTYDPATQTYTSTGGGIRPAKGSEGAYYGTVSADFEVPADSEVTGLGLFWNATYPDDDNPYNGTGVSYHYMHLNPQNGGFQYARVDGDAETSYANTNYAKALAPAWSEKWGAWDTARKAGEDTPLTFTLKVEFTPTGMTLYIDSEKLGTYTGEYLNALTGKLAGIRAGGKGIVAKNVSVKASSDYPDAVVHVLSFETEPSYTLPDMLWAEGAPVEHSLPLGVYNGYEYTWYTDASHDTPVGGNSLSSYVLYGLGAAVELKNGYKVYEDKYVVNGSPSTPVIITLPEIEGTTGQLSATFTATKETGKIGLFFLATVPEAEGNVLWNNAEVDGYSLYFNFGTIVDQPNAYFTLGHIVGGKYDASKNTQAEFGPYNYGSATAGHGEYTKLYNDIFALNAGTKDSVTFRMTLTVTETRIVFALNGFVLFVRANPNTKGGAAVHHDGTGWGFYADGAGTWSEIEFSDEIREKDGFIITKDEAGKDVYTSAPLSATMTIATLAEGLGGQYGKFEATVTVSNPDNGRIGLLINAALTDAADGGDLVWSDTSVDGFFLYHNFKANANFTLASVLKGTYTTGGTALSYAADGAAKDSAPQQLKDYHAKVAALLADTVSSVTVKIAIEVIEGGTIKIYVDDLLYITNTAYYAKNPDLAGLTGVGLVAYGPGTVFSDISFVPAE